MLYIIEVVLKLDVRVFETFTIALIDQGPSSRSRLYRIASPVVRDALFHLWDVPLGPRADEAHIAHEDIVKLWQFINVGRTQDAADTCNTLIFPCGKGGVADTVSVGYHRAELPKAEGIATFAQPLRPVEDRAR